MASIGGQAKRRLVLRAPKEELTGCIVDGDTGKQYPYRLVPNQVCEVEDVVYSNLKRKFGQRREVTVAPDGLANLERPRKPHEAPIMLTEEVEGAPIIEFLG